MFWMRHSLLGEGVEQGFGWRTPACGTAVQCNRQRALQEGVRDISLANPSYWFGRIINDGCKPSLRIFSHSFLRLMPRLSAVRAMCPPFSTSA